MKDRIAAFTRQICEVIVGKEQAIKLAVACLLARGHLLIEDIPGVGKTTLSQALARSLGLGFQRIQFTSDLLPADILGNSIFDREAQRFVFHHGPLFAQVVLIDEVNRATAKTQSALLQAMEENHISADGVTHELPQPFFVIATQNPQHQVGTFPLPESQLDRFLMRIQLGVPDRASERTMLLGMDRREMLKELKPVFSARRTGGDPGCGAQGAHVGGVARLPAGPARCLTPASQQRSIAARRARVSACRAGVGVDEWTRHGPAGRRPGGRHRRHGPPSRA